MKNQENNKSKHTQGEWIISHGANHIPSIGSKILHQPIAHLCRVNEETKGIDAEAEANARLIAAAPDMLEALKVLRVEAYKGERTDLLEIIDPVIAKAEGRGNEGA